MNALRRFFIALTSYYNPHFLPALVYLLEQGDYSVLRYLARFWNTQDFSKYSGKRATPTLRNRALFLFIFLGALLQNIVALAVLIVGGRDGVAGSVPFGLALIISYPFVWAHMLALLYTAHKLIWSLVNPKVAGRNIVGLILENQFVRLKKKHGFKVVAVAGSVGKTSTKLAIAHTLESSRRVIYQTGNYNHRVTVPLAIFGRNLPSLFNILAWIKLFMANESTIRGKYYYDIAVVELGTDHPGELAQFAYLQPDIAVIAAITPEHMETFKTLDAVADEEFVVSDFSAITLVNGDDTDEKYRRGRKVLTYGLSKTGNDFWASGYNLEGLKGGAVTLHLQAEAPIKAHAAIIGEQGAKILLAAASVAQLLGLSRAEIEKGLHEVKPFAGRMQILDGVKDSTIIDDSYNASPAPIKAALDVLYKLEASQRIAILGTMNELGDYSKQAHVEVGEYCRADKLDLVVTIGEDANNYLAVAAEANGCKVLKFTSPYAAGDAVLDHLKKGAIVLVEGSQNKVFAEESIKVLLADKADSKRLVRQGASWMALKKKQFSSNSAVSNS